MIATLILGLLFTITFQDKRQPVPPDADVKEAEKLVRDLFKDDYAKKAPIDRHNLAKKLLAQGKESANTPASQYALLTQALELSTQAADAELAIAALNDLAAAFTVDLPALRTSTFAALSKAAKTADEFKALAKANLQIADDAVKADDYDAAVKAAAEAGKLSRAAKDAQLTTAADAKIKEVGFKKLQFEKVRKAKEALVTSPDDPAANLALGQYTCFGKGDWAAGVPMLAKSPDGPIKTAATKDAANPEAPEEQAATGDAWWDLSETGPPDVKAGARDRAGYWYAKAVVKVAGLPKVRVEKRLMQWNTERLARGTWIDYQEPASFGAKGKVGDPIEVVQVSDKTIKSLESKPFPAGEYDGFTMRVRMKAMTKPSVNVMYKAPGAPGFHFAIIREDARTITITGPNGPNKAPSTVVPLTVADEYVLTMVHAKGMDTIFLNGIEIGSSPNETGHFESFQLYCYAGTTTFDKIKLRRK